MKINRQEVISFSKKYIFIFFLGIVGWEAYHLINSPYEIGLLDIIEAVSLFCVVSATAIFLVSFIRGWIEF